MIRNKAKDDNHHDDDSIARDSGRDRRAPVVSTNAIQRATSLHTKTHASHVCVDRSLAANRRPDDDASSLA